VQRQDRLLLLALDTDGLDVRRTSSLEQRVAVGPIGLVPPPVGLHIVRRQEANVEVEADEQARPVVGTAAGLHHHRAGLTGLPEALELRTGEALAFDDFARRLGDGDLEDILGQIHGDG
jgi:hypothetical protein